MSFNLKNDLINTETDGKYNTLRVYSLRFLPIIITFQNIFNSINEFKSKGEKRDPNNKEIKLI
jgi:hypothetical protein